MKKPITVQELDRKFDSSAEDVLEHFDLSAERVTTEQLRELSPLLNMTELARRAGIRKTTLASKIQRGTPLNDDESLVLRRVLRDAGMMITDHVSAVRQTLRDDLEQPSRNQRSNLDHDYDAR